MGRSHLHPFLEKLPKAEHHVHLEGALSVPLLFELAARNGIALPQSDAAFASQESLSARYERFTSLDDFLQYYYTGMSVLIHQGDFEALAWDYFQRASADGVHHAEVFFDPQAHMSRGVSYSTVLSGFNAARSRAQSELGISTELICCFLRHLPVPDALETFHNPDVQASYANGTIKGIGLDSSELDYPPQLFVELFALAKKQGLRLTSHWGEEGPAAYIANAIEMLGTERVDHGRALADDEELMQKVATSGIMLTLCPTSNVVLKGVPSIKDLPVRKFLDAGVRFSINSDDPAYFGGYILDNYCAVHEAFDLSVAEWTRICRAGIEGSWCDDARKSEMLKVLGQVVEEWKEQSA